MVSHDGQRSIIIIFFHRNLPTQTSATSLATTNPSGLDWNALIQAEVNAKLAAATTVETKITNNEAKVSAYQNLQTLLSSLASAANPLASSNTSSLSTSIFSARSADITANGNVSANSVASMTLNNGAPVGTYTLEVGSLAQAQKVAGASVASESTPLGYTGSFSLGLAGGASATVSITADMTLQDVVADINAQMDTTDVQASIVQVSASQYEMVLTGTQDGANIVTSSTSGDDVLAGLDVTDGSGNFKDEIQKAQMANITLDGINITRNTNDISDVLDGVTFHLLQSTPAGTSLNINVGTDADQITTALQSAGDGLQCLSRRRHKSAEDQFRRDCIIRYSSVRRLHHERYHDAASKRHEHLSKRSVAQRSWSLLLQHERSATRYRCSANDAEQ